MESINLKDILRAFVKWWVLIAVLTVVSGAGFYVYSRYFVTPLYTSTGRLYVNSSQVRGFDVLDTGTISASQKMVPSCIEVLKSTTFLEEVAEKTGMNISASVVSGAIRLSSANDTEILKVSAVYKDKQGSARIAQTLMDNAQAQISKVIKAGSVEIIDNASIPAKASSPDIKRQTLTGFLTGLFLGMLIAVFMEMLDNRIKDEEALLQNFDFPILGVIPEVE